LDGLTNKLLDGAEMEQFWLTIRFRGQSIAEKYASLPIGRQREVAAGAFEK
jgi:hypothetical protein